MTTSHSRNGVPFTLDLSVYFGTMSSVDTVALPVQAQNVEI